MNLEKLKYPIGTFQVPKEINESHLSNWINSIQTFPNRIKAEIESLNTSELKNRYRPGGWTIRQVLNHCIDSHMNSVVRFKLALTEDSPIIRPYEEQFWAELPDTLEYDINDSFILLSAIHKRWVFLLKNMSIKDYNKTFIHPSGNETISLKENLCIYAWHCDHHLQHIINAKQFKF